MKILITHSYLLNTVFCLLSVSHDSKDKNVIFRGFLSFCNFSLFLFFVITNEILIVITAFRCPNLGRLSCLNFSLSFKIFHSSIKTMLQVGPLSIAVDASNWSKYTGGVFNGCSFDENISINHGVQLVGYGSDFSAL